jgi:hypothetical protein
MAKTSTVTSKPVKPRRRQMVSSPFQARAASPGVRDRTGEQLRECRSQLATKRAAITAVTGQARRLNRMVTRDKFKDYTTFRNMKAATERLSQSAVQGALGGLGTTSVMSPTMWGLAGVVVGAGAMYLWSLR